MRWKCMKFMMISTGFKIQVNLIQKIWDLVPGFFVIVEKLYVILAQDS